jgi:hypothetical protein
MGLSDFRQIGAERAAEWEEKGHRRRHFFAHRLFQLPKCGPDGYRIAERMCGERDLNRHWQLLLYADPALVKQFPRSLFFDDDLIWHQQHFGRPGQVASATVVIRSGVLYSMVHHADLVQRIGRFREHKTQIEKKFGGWPWMLVNGSLALALECGIGTVRTPSSRLAMENTDPARDVQPYLFERIYDRPVAEFPGAVRRGEWWEIDVSAAAAAVVLPIPGQDPVAEEKTVCVMHDVERGFGHRGEDPDLARHADETGDESLAAMLAAEASAGVRATYNVVGTFLDDVRSAIERDGHALAFHSFDHSDDGDQLHRCREVDYRLKGYRLPRSRGTPETTDENLAFHNFEWLASARIPLGTELPVLRDRLVRLPVTLDDFALYTGVQTYDQWEGALLDHVEQAPYTTVGLHDCYAHLWLPRYPELLEKLKSRASLRTLDDVAADVWMGAADYASWRSSKGATKSRMRSAVRSVVNSWRQASARSPAAAIAARSAATRPTSPISSTTNPMSNCSIRSTTPR